MEKLKVVYMGTPEFSVKPLEELNKKYDVKLVVTQPDKEVGRKKEIKFSPVKEYALKEKIEVFQPTKIRENYKKILDIKPDIIITCAYGQIIPKELLELPKYKCVNIHASLLPKYRAHQFIIQLLMVMNILVLLLCIWMKRWILEIYYIKKRLK